MNWQNPELPTLLILCYNQLSYDPNFPENHLLLLINHTVLIKKSSLEMALVELECQHQSLLTCSYSYSVLTLLLGSGVSYNLRSMDGEAKMLPDNENHDNSDKTQIQTRLYSDYEKLGLEMEKKFRELDIILAAFWLFLRPWSKVSPVDIWIGEYSFPAYPQGRQEKMRHSELPKYHLFVIM